MGFGVSKRIPISGPTLGDIAMLSLRYEYSISRNTFAGRLALTQNGATSPLGYFVSHRHICAIPHFVAYREIIVRYPRKKQALNYFCNAIATGIMGYEKYRCWEGNSHLLVSTLSLGAARPATILSHTCDIPSLLKDDQLARDNRLPVRCRRLRSPQHCKRHTPRDMVYLGRKCLQKRKLSEIMTSHDVF